MTRSSKWTIPGIAALLGWTTLGLSAASASKISTTGAQASAWSGSRSLSDLNRRSLFLPDVTTPVDLESLSRSLARLDPGQPLFDRMSASPGMGWKLLPDDMLRRGPSTVWPSGLPRPSVGDFDRVMIARDSDSIGPEASRPTTPHPLPSFSIPEPASLLLITAGLMGLWVRGRLARSRAQ